MRTGVVRIHARGWLRAHIKKRRMLEPHNPDRSSLRSWLAGDERAFADLHVRHWRLVLAACQRRLPVDEAEDAAQAVFLVLMRKGAEALQSVSLESWLLAVTRRVVANAVRSRIRRRHAERGAMATPIATSPDAGGSEMLPLLDRCLEALPMRERMVVTMHYLAGRTHDEIALSLGCPKGTVYSLLSRGLGRLRGKLERRGAGISVVTLLAVLGTQAQARAAETMAVGGGLLGSSGVGTKAVVGAVSGTSHYAGVAALVLAAGAALALASLPLLTGRSPAATPSIALTTGSASMGTMEDHRDGAWEERERQVLARGLADVPALARSEEIWRLWFAQRLFSAGRGGEGQEILARAVDRLGAGTRDVFLLWAVLDCYLAHRELIASGLAERIRLLCTAAVGAPLPGDDRSAHHDRAQAIISHLVQAQWPAEYSASRMRGDLSADDPTLSRWLLDHLGRMAKDGVAGFASQIHSGGSLLPLVSLMRFSPEGEVRAAARFAFEVSLAHLAGFWLRGQLAAPSTHNSLDLLSQQPQANLGHLWMYFGGVPGTACTSAIVPLSCDYRPPPALVEAASDRSRPYVSRSRFDGPGSFQYSYINRRYALFSSAASGAQGIHERSHPYGVMWDESDQDRTGFLWVTVPVNDGRGSSAHAYGLDGRHVQFIQHEDSMALVATDLSGSRFPYVLACVPGGYQASLFEGASAGRLFLHYRSVLIAISATAPFTWNILNSMTAGVSHRGDSGIRIYGEHVAVGVETALPEDFPGATPVQRLSAFRAAVLARSSVSCIPPGGAGDGATVVYTTRHGHRLERTFSGQGPARALIDGRALDYTTWPLLENPWLRHEWQGDLVLTADGVTRIYRMDSRTISETHQDGVVSACWAVVKN